MRKFMLLLLMLCMQGHLLLHGQIVNIESSRIQSDSTGWLGGAGAGFSLVKNTRQIFNVAVEAHLQYKTEKSLWLILGDYGFLKGGGDKFISNSFAHIRYNKKINKWLRWEAFGQMQSNLITQIQSRFLTGTGPRFKILSLKKFRLYAASLIMFEHEKERSSPGIIHNDVRSSSYISFTFLPFENVELISTTFYQPLVKRFSDQRIFNQSSLRIKANKHFAMYMRWNHLTDKAPAKFAPQTTYNFTSGFELEF